MLHVDALAPMIKGCCAIKVRGTIRVCGMTRVCACCTSMPRPQMSVAMSTRLSPERNSAMMASRSFCGMSPCIAETVKLAWRILFVSQSTFFLVLQNMTACVIVRVS